MTNLKRIIALLALLLLFNRHIAAQLTTDEIINKNLEITGLNKETKINSFMINGNLIQNRFTLPFEMLGILPNFQRVSMFFGGIALIKTSNGKTDWVLDPINDTLIVKKGKPGEAKNFYSRWTGDLTEYKEGEISGELLGTDTIEDVAVYKLKMKKNDKVRTYYIDKLSYLLLRVDDEDPDVQKSTYYSDYKNVNGFLLAHKLNGFEFGKLVMTMVFNKVKINTPIDKSLFNVPSKE